jgi:predicted nucleic acid-binding protein
VEALTKPSVYLETTLFNYYFDTDRKGHNDTVKLFEYIGNGKISGFTSGYVVDELTKTPDDKKEKRINMLNLIPKFNLTTFMPIQIINSLANIYIKDNVIPAEFLTDALHIACASLNKIDFLLTFNIKHMLQTKDKINEINFREGYHLIKICNPSEVLNYEQQLP